MEACRICGTYQSDHGVTELWVEVTETYRTCQSDREGIDLWVEVTDACQVDRGEVLLNSGVVHSASYEEILAPVGHVRCVGQIRLLETSHVEQKGNEP